MRKSAKYYEVYNQIKKDIISDTYPSGSFLPTEKELMAKYDASRTTIRHAISLLRDENIVSVTQGRGTQVEPHGQINKNSYRLFHNVTEVNNYFAVPDEPKISVQGGMICVLPAQGEVAEALKIPNGTPVYKLERLALVNGTPFSYQVNYLRKDLLPNFENFSGSMDKLHDIYHFISEEYGIYFNTGVETISAIVADLFEAKLLEVNLGTPLLAFTRTSVFGEEILEYMTLRSRPDLLKISVSMSGPPAYFH